MNIISASQMFSMNERGEIGFTHTQLVYTFGGCVFSAKWPYRKFNAAQLKGPDQLEDVEPIPVEAYRPIVPYDSITVCNVRDAYIKTPNLSGFDGGETLAKHVLREIKTCESIQKNPHINLVTYYGCSLVEGRIAGLCFRQYPANLMTIVNPGHLNKSMLIESEERKKAREQAADYLNGIEEGICHLHTLGIIHNDINPANILITEDKIPVVSDFDSSSPRGAELSHVKRTHGWFDPAVQEARESNDLHALSELEIWLTGSSREEYRFMD